MTLHTKRPLRSRLRRGVRSPLGTILTTVTAGLVGMLMSFGIAGHATAAPSPAEIEAQIDEAWNKLEPTIELHNKVRAELNVNKAKAQQLGDQIRPLQLRVDLAFGKVSGLSAYQYKSGPASTFNAILSSGSPQRLADQLSLLNALARAEQSQIKDVLALKAQYDAQKKPLDELVTQQTAQENELAEKEKFINAEIKRLNELRTQVYGTSAGTGTLKPVACPMEYVGGQAAKAAQVACNQIGKNYVFGAEGPNTFDCSGLMMYAWAQAGVKKLRHYTQWQFDDTKRVSRAELKAGDLVFYYGDRHHVGMYVGGGWIVHAPTSGDKVRMKKVDDGPINGYGRVV